MKIVSVLLVLSMSFICIYSYSQKQLKLDEIVVNYESTNYLGNSKGYVQYLYAYDNLGNVSSKQVVKTQIFDSFSSTGKASFHQFFYTNGVHSNIKIANPNIKDKIEFWEDYQFDYSDNSIIKLDRYSQKYNSNYQKVWFLNSSDIIYQDANSVYSHERKIDKNGQMVNYNRKEYMYNNSLLEKSSTYEWVPATNTFMKAYWTESFIDNSSHIIKDTTSNVYTSEKSSRICTCDANWNILEEEYKIKNSLTNNLWKLNEKRINTYDSKQNLILTIGYKWSNNAWVQAYKYEYIYDTEVLESEIAKFDNEYTKLFTTHLLNSGGSNMPNVDGYYLYFQQEKHKYKLERLLYTDYLNLGNTIIVDFKYSDLEDNASSLADLSCGASLKLYPNPSHDFIHIDNTPIDCHSGYIINIKGLLVKSFSLSPSVNSIDIKDLPKGLYILKLKLSTGLLTRKFIKN